MTTARPGTNQTRRAFLRRGAATGALIVGGTALVGTTAAHPKPEENHTVVWGDDLDYLDGDLITYATTNPQGNLSSLGVYLDKDALETFADDPLGAHLQFPESVDTHEFTFLGFHYNPMGHPPMDIYTVPHFDLHFNLIPEETVEGIPGGPATYDIPSELMPTDYSRLPAIDMDGDGAPDTPAVEEDMGEHLGDLSSPEFQEEGEFTHTMIYGAFDTDGDGSGQLTFVEPMITTQFLDEFEDELVVDIKTPEEFAVAGEYPTQYAIKRGLHGGIYISLDGFQEFPGGASPARERIDFLDLARGGDRR